MDIQAKLSEPFAVDEVQWKAQTVRGNRALAVAYVDARCVMDRLDAVFGVAGWQDEYGVLANGSVVCKLRCLVDGLWIEKSDVGSESEQPDGGDRVKAAFSDAIKRAAVKWGAGRYLYSLPRQWVEYDPQTRQLKGTPKLPDWAVPRPPKKDPPSQAKDPSAGPPLPTAGEFITKAQADNIRHQLLRRDDELRGGGKKVSRKRFLALFGAESPEKILAKDLQRALLTAGSPGMELLVAAEEKPAPVA